ncbi:hypothetical protein Vretimale_18681 [Volvox reticuliferus]|nr:hypothetical protein Vretimale_18681 [Volvox reticuliferus]
MKPGEVSTAGDGSGAAGCSAGIASGGFDSLALEAAAIATAASFSQLVAPRENAEHLTVTADPVALEHMYTSWAQQLLQPLWLPELLLVLPSEEASGDGYCAGAEASPAGEVTGQGQRLVRCVMTSQLSYLNPRITACPLCVCHGLPTRPPPSHGPPAGYCQVDSGLLLPPHATTIDLLTARLAPGQELRLSGRQGAPPPGVLAPVPPPPSHGRQAMTATASGTTVEHLPRLYVERVVRMEEVDASVQYGWPQVLLAAEDLDPHSMLDDHGGAIRHGGGGDTYGRGGGGDAVAANAEWEGDKSVREFLALAQVLLQGGLSLLASAPTCLCEFPASSAHWRPAPASLRQWYLIIPSAGSFLLRQVACREQLMPLQPMPPVDGRDAALTTAATAAARRSLQRLPGWEVAAESAARPAMPGGPCTPPSSSVALVPAAVTKAEGSSRGGDNDALAGGRGGPASAPEVHGSGPASSDCPAATTAIAETAACKGNLETQMQDPQQPHMIGSVRYTTAQSHVDGVSGATVSSSSAVPAPHFSPLQLSSGCHELLAMLVRDSVRLTPRAVSLSATVADTSTAPPVVGRSPSPQRAFGVPVGGPVDAVQPSALGSHAEQSEALPAPALLQPLPQPTAQPKPQQQQQQEHEKRVLPTGTHPGSLPCPMSGGLSAGLPTVEPHHSSGPARTRQFGPSPEPRKGQQLAAQRSHGDPIAHARAALSQEPGSAAGLENPNPNLDPHRGQGGSRATRGPAPAGALAVQPSVAPTAPRQLSLPPPQQLPPPLQQHQQQTQQQDGGRRPLRLKPSNRS